MLLSGCEGFRYAATEAQKENAWLHTQVCAEAADAAEKENASPDLCELTAQAHEQSTAFVADYGVPDTFATGYPHGQADPSAALGTWLDRATLQTVTAQAKADSLRKPDAWALADSAMELGIALAGLLGGAYGIRIAGAIKTAREKSKALQEIVTGNELFKQLYPEHADRFKTAQQKQSPETKQLVTQLKAG
jgi:hypothetical protein